MHNVPAQASQPVVEVRIPTEHGALKAALARPSNNNSPAPGVIVLHELFGLNNDIRRIAEQFADHGYVAIAPDLYSVGPPLRPICIAQTVRMMRRGAGRPFDLIEASRAWLADRDEVDESRLAVAGFCLGGGFAMLYAARAPLGAAAVFYGQAPRSARRLEGICATFGAYGDQDRIAGRDAEVLRAHLEELGVDHEVKVYPGAGHSFMHQYSGLRGQFVRLGPGPIGFDEPVAADAWASMLQFFDQHLSGTNEGADAS